MSQRAISSPQLSSHLVDLRVFEREHRHHLVEIGRLGVRHAQLEGLVGVEGQQLARIDDAVDHDLVVDHRLGDVAPPTVGFGGRPHLGPHVRHHLFADRIGLPAGARLNGRRGANGRALGHDHVVTGQADQSAGADRAWVDEGDGTGLGFEQRVSNLDCRVDAPTERVDVEHDRGGVGIGFDRAPNERSQAELDRAVDRDDDDLAPRGRVDRKGLHVTLNVGARLQADSRDRRHRRASGRGSPVPCTESRWRSESRESSSANTVPTSRRGT